MKLPRLCLGQARRSLATEKRVASSERQSLSALSGGKAAPLSQLQCRETQKREQDRENQKAKHDLRLFPAAHFKVMVQRRHAKQASPGSCRPLRHLEEADLEHHRKR